MHYEKANLSVKDLQRPCVVVNRLKVDASIARLRNHLKTVKSYDVAILVMDSPQGPAAVSTLREAEEFSRHGVTDSAVEISPQRLGRVTALRKSGVDPKVVVDSVAAVRAVAEHAASTSDRISSLVEIDVDAHRAGIALNGQVGIIEVGRALRRREVLAVMTHAGESYDPSQRFCRSLLHDGRRCQVRSRIDGQKTWV